MSMPAPRRMTYPEPFWKQIVPRLIEAYLLRMVRLAVVGSEANIPRSEAAICAFAPHCGWVDSFVIDESYRRAGMPWPAWLTKEENRSLPGIITGSRVICMDRETPEPGAVRTVDHLLRQPSAMLATSLEGTRFANPNDPDDAMTLGPFKRGAAWFALRARVPILPTIVLGGHTLLPRLDDVWAKQGTLGALRVVRSLMANPQPVQVCFLPPYRAHLDGDNAPRGRALTEQAKRHTARLREIVVAGILARAPDYPVDAR